MKKAVENGYVKQKPGKIKVEKIKRTCVTCKKVFDQSVKGVEIKSHLDTKCGKGKKMTDVFGSEAAAFYNM